MCPPMGTEVGELVLVTARSATGFTVVVTEAELFAGLGSGSVALTLAGLVMEGAAAACGVTTIVGVGHALLARELRMHRTRAADWEQERRVGWGETKSNAPARGD